MLAGPLFFPQFLSSLAKYPCVATDANKINKFMNWKGYELQDHSQ
jgi:hypothetical protein